MAYYKQKVTTLTKTGSYDIRSIDWGFSTNLFVCVATTGSATITMVTSSAISSGYGIVISKMLQGGTITIARSGGTVEYISNDGEANSYILVSSRYHSF